MRRGKDARAYYACGNHLHKRTVSFHDGTQAPCPMLPVFEQDVKNAFATALNRLAADPSILAIPDDGEAERERLEAQLQSIKRRQSVLHDRALADRYTAQLWEKKAALDSEETRCSGGFSGRKRDHLLDGTRCLRTALGVLSR